MKTSQQAGNCTCGSTSNQPTVTARSYFVRNCYIKFIALRFTLTVSFFDEAAFHLNGIVSRYNRRIWSSQPPQVIIDHWGVRPKVNVWCDMMTAGINGPFFLSFFQEATVKGLNAATIPLRCILPAEWRPPILENFSVTLNVVSTCVEQLMVLTLKLTAKREKKKTLGSELLS